MLWIVFIFFCSLIAKCVVISYHLKNYKKLYQYVFSTIFVWAKNEYLGHFWPKMFILTNLISGKSKILYISFIFRQAFSVCQKFIGPFKGTGHCFHILSIGCGRATVLTTHAHHKGKDIWLTDKYTNRCTFRRTACPGMVASQHI